MKPYRIAFFSNANQACLIFSATLTTHMENCRTRGQNSTTVVYTGKDQMRKILSSISSWNRSSILLHLSSLLCLTSSSLLCIRRTCTPIVSEPSISKSVGDGYILYFSWWRSAFICHSSTKQEGKWNLPLYFFINCLDFNRLRMRSSNADWS